MIRIVFTDIDGVWTDGGMFYDESGHELKRFSTYDGAGVALLRFAGIKVCILTGENTSIVSKRAEKLKVDRVLMGVTDKLHAAEEICLEYGFSIDEAGYIGDDFNDIALLRAVSVSAAPANAHQYVKEVAKYILDSRGGDGAFREFVEKYIIDEKTLIEYIATNYKVKM
jgi:YrbI family 3-deoxy-D-manno-octulosonate 8-phosphate phosphatase